MNRLSHFIFFGIVCFITFLPKQSLGQSDYEKQISVFANSIAEKITQSGKLRVAVADFLDNNGNLTEFGKAMAEEFAVNLMNSSKGFQVMERSDLTAILKEHNLASTGLIDPETAKKLGKLKAVDVIIVGTITPYSEYFRMSIKILDTETGMAIGGTMGNIARIDPLNKLFENKLVLGTSNQQSKTIVNNPITSPQKIEETKDSGDFCFINNATPKDIYGTKYACKVKIDIYNSNNALIKSINVEQSEKSYVYELPIGIYKIVLTWHWGDNNFTDVKETKEIRIRAGKMDSLELFHNPS